MEIQTLIEQNRTNHYKMLVIIDNNNQHQRIIDSLKDEGWSAYDVTNHILQLTEQLPEHKVSCVLAKRLKTGLKAY